MNPYAVIATGGKQYLVEPKNTLKVERLDVEAGSTLVIKSVLAVSRDGKLIVGTPEVSDATVTSTVIEHTRGKKVVSYKKKRRKGYERKIGHRQELTVLRIESIA